MIATMLIGGMGNQMFQYAAGRTLALRHGTDVTLDLSSFSKSRNEPIPRLFELDRLKIVSKPANFARHTSLFLARRKQHNFIRMSGWQPLREASLAYDERFESAPDQSYLIGYWQSWRYLTEFAANIAAELQPRSPLSARNRQMQSDMLSKPSLSIHVRRTDYLHVAHAFHGALDLDFYVQAVAEVLQVAPEVDIYIFSDDLEWCREAFAPLGWNATFVDWNRDEDSWQDLYLMSACQHSIIANSSFSWWAAWLGDQANRGGRRIVVAPSKWFAGGNVSATDRCPPAWTII